MGTTAGEPHSGQDGVGFGRLIFGFFPVKSLS
jgi:hypothetical protein